MSTYLVEFEDTILVRRTAKVFGVNTAEQAQTKVAHSDGILIEKTEEIGIVDGGENFRVVGFEPDPEPEPTK